VVTALLAAGADPGVVDSGGISAMTYAAASGSTGAIEALTKKGVKPVGRDLVAAVEGCHAPAVALLLTTGLKANDPVAGKAPLIVAASESCADAVTALLDKGADINVRDGDGRTPLIIAAAGNMVDVARVLLARGADVTLADRLDRTALMYASMVNREAMAELFKEMKK